MRRNFELTDVKIGWGGGLKSIEGNCRLLLARVYIKINLL